MKRILMLKFHHRHQHHQHPLDACMAGGNGVHPLLLRGDLGQLCHLHGAVTLKSVDIDANCESKTPTESQSHHAHVQSIDQIRAIHFEWEDQQLVVLMNRAWHGPLLAPGETLSLSFVFWPKNFLNSDDFQLKLDCVDKMSCPGRGPCQSRCWPKQCWHRD